MKEEKRLYRNVTIDTGSIDEESRSIDLSFSSEQPYKRYSMEHGEVMEILSHDEKEADLSRLNDSAPLLVNHNTDDQVGVVERATLDNGRGIAKVRFGKSERANEIYQDVLDGIRKNVSVGYEWTSQKLVKTNETPQLIVGWRAFEISLASIPADNSVGVGRSEEENITQKESEMADNKVEPEIQVKDKAPEVDVREVMEKATGAELKRVSEIIAICDDYPELYDEAKKAIVEKKSESEFKSMALERIKNMTHENTVDVTPEIGMDEKERKQYSWMNVIMAQAFGKPEIASFERECSDEVQKRLGLNSPRGYYIPMDMLTKDQTVGTATAGGNLVATDLLAGSFIDRLKKDLVVGQAGATILDGLVGDVAIPRMTSGTTAYWLAESGNATESQTAYDQVTMTPKTVSAFTDISRKLIQQSTPAIENLVKDDLRFVLAEAIDLAAIDGTGANNQPTGVLQTSGISNGDWATASTPTWAEIVGLESTLGTANALKGNLAYMTTPAFAGTMKSTLKASNVAGYIMNDDNTMNGYNTLKTNNCQADTVIFGNWRDLLIGFWGTLDMTVDPYTSSTTGTVRIVVFQDCDIAVRHGASFAVEENTGS